MNFLVDFARFVDVENIVAVDIVFHNEVQTAKRRDKRAGHTKHHRHAKK